MKIDTILYLLDLAKRDLREKQNAADESSRELRNLMRRNAGKVDANGNPFEISHSAEELETLVYKTGNDLANAKLRFADFMEHDWK